MLRRIVAISFGLIAGWTVYGLGESKLLAVDEVGPTTKNVERIQLDTKTQAMLDSITQAYTEPFEVSGKLTGLFDVAGQKDQKEFDFSSTFGGTNLIRHESKLDVLIIVDGKTASLYHTKGGYFSTNELKGAELPNYVLSTLQSQNPALLVAVKEDARAALFPAGTRLVRSQTREELGGEFDLIEVESDDAKIVYQIDRGGHFKQIDFDFSAMLERKGVAGIRSATYQLRFASSVPANVTDDTFKFIAPAGARDLAKEPQQHMTESAVEKLLDKPAPPFEGRDLDGNIIGLPGFKDRVVVLDFWATWCGPCKPALDHLKTYQERFGEDVTILTINCEGADDLDEVSKKVRTYFEKNDFDFKTLLDDGEISQTYTVTALPTRLLIGRDGTVKKVAIGAGHEANRLFDEAVEAALKE